MWNALPWQREGGNPPFPVPGNWSGPKWRTSMSCPSLFATKKRRGVLLGPDCRSFGLFLPIWKMMTRWSTAAARQGERQRGEEEKGRQGIGISVGGDFIYGAEWRQWMRETQVSMYDPCASHLPKGAFVSNGLIQKVMGGGRKMNVFVSFHFSNPKIPT